WRHKRTPLDRELACHGFEFGYARNEQQYLKKSFHPSVPLAPSRNHPELPESCHPDHTHGA
ncbi:hypothetical protein QIG14_27050, partial [Klebsiella pneumoniae]|nr:hypothetical protein [Klebsiella pneumoniae]